MYSNYVRESGKNEEFLGQCKQGGKKKTQGTKLTPSKCKIKTQHLQGGSGSGKDGLSTIHSVSPTVCRFKIWTQCMDQRSEDSGR